MLNYRLAIIIAVIAYLASFLVGILFGVLLETETGATLQEPWVVNGVQLVSIALIGVLSAWAYFHFAQTRATMQKGALVGAALVVVGFVFDALLLIPLVLSGFPASVALSIYTDPIFWSTIALLIVATTLTGAIYGRRSEAR